MDNQKLYDALNTIKEYCAQSRCKDCALDASENIGSKCKLYDGADKAPMNWKLKNPKLYKAFEE